MEFPSFLKNPWVLGGVGLAVLAGAFVLTRPAANSDAAGSDEFFPPIVVGGANGGIPTADPGGLNASTAYSTDNSISQLIASNLATATMQSDLTKYTSDNDKSVALATLSAQKEIALDTNKTTIQQALASQLGAVVSAFTTTTSKSKSGFLGIGGGSSSTTQGPTSILGSIGFDNGKIAIDIARDGAKPAATPVAPVAAKQLVK